MESFAEGGSDDAANLLALCPNCHADHHEGKIPVSSIKAWKMLLVSLNEAFDKRSVDLLLFLAKHGGTLIISSDGVLQFASLITSGLVQYKSFATEFRTTLSPQGKIFVDGWKKGDQKAAVYGSPPPPASTAT